MIMRSRQQGCRSPSIKSLHGQKKTGRILVAGQKPSPRGKNPHDTGQIHPHPENNLYSRSAQIRIYPNMTPAPKKAVLILSGGMDSTTLLYDLISQKYEVHAITFNYHQKHSNEIACAEKICKKLGIPHKIVDISVLNELAPSCLTRDQWDVPEGNYADDNMKQTVVPNRNMVFLSLAASYAIGIGANHLFYAAHAGDHTIYPDYRPAFISAMGTAFHLCDWNDVVLEAPYQVLVER